MLGALELDQTLQTTGVGGTHWDYKGWRFAQNPTEKPWRPVDFIFALRICVSLGHCGVPAQPVRLQRNLRAVYCQLTKRLRMGVASQHPTPLSRIMGVFSTCCCQQSRRQQQKVKIDERAWSMNNPGGGRQQQCSMSNKCTGMNVSDMKPATCHGSSVQKDAVNARAAEQARTALHLPRSSLLPTHLRLTRFWLLHKFWGSARQLPSHGGITSPAFVPLAFKY